MAARGAEHVARIVAEGDTTRRGPWLGRWAGLDRDGWEAAQTLRERKARAALAAAEAGVARAASALSAADRRARVLERGRERAHEAFLLTEERREERDRSDTYAAAAHAARFAR